MSQVSAGRYSARIDGPFVVFNIGMRLNRLWALHRWPKPAWNTWRMVRYLADHPPVGYLGGQLFCYWRGVGMFQYWKDFEALEAFARDKDQPHLAAWQHLVRQTAQDATFGYWHETYQINPDQYECIYGSMPRFGLARAAEHVAIAQTTQSARDRLDRQS